MILGFDIGAALIPDVSLFETVVRGIVTYFSIFILLRIVLRGRTSAVAMGRARRRGPSRRIEDQYSVGNRSRRFGEKSTGLASRSVSRSSFVPPNLWRLAST